MDLMYVHAPIFAPRLGGEKLDAVPQYLYFPLANSLNIIHGTGTEFGGNPDASAVVIVSIPEGSFGYGEIIDTNMGPGGKRSAITFLAKLPDFNMHQSDGRNNLSPHHRTYAVESLVRAIQYSLVCAQANSSSDIRHANGRNQKPNPELRAAPNRPLSQAQKSRPQRHSS